MLFLILRHYAEVAESHEDLNNKTVETVLNAVLKTITDGVKGGDKIVLTGFGSFEVGAEVQGGESSTPA